MSALINDEIGLVSYELNGIMYYIDFPIEYAMTHLPSTGPHNCGNCAKYCTIRGAFIGYCANCLIIYKNLNMARGNCNDNCIFPSNASNYELWKTYPYLKGATINDPTEEEMNELIANFPLDERDFDDDNSFSNTSVDDNN